MDFVGFDTSGATLVSSFAGLYSTICGDLNDVDYLVLSLGEEKLVFVFDIGLSYLEADEFKLTAVLFVLFG